MDSTERHIPAQERFTSGQTDFAYPQSGSHPHNPGNLLIGQEMERGFHSC